MATKSKFNPNDLSTWTFPGQPTYKPRGVRKVKPVTDELYHWIKNAIQSKTK